MIGTCETVACRELLQTDQPLHGRQKVDQPLQHLIEQLEPHGASPPLSIGMFRSACPLREVARGGSDSMPIGYGWLAESAPPEWIVASVRDSTIGGENHQCS
jgi:hypothetical protein